MHISHTIFDICQYSIHQYTLNCANTVSLAYIWHDILIYSYISSVCVRACVRARVCVCVCVCVCVSTNKMTLLITSGKMWCDMVPQHDWLNKFYSFYMAAVVGIISKYVTRYVLRI